MNAINLCRWGQRLMMVLLLSFAPGSEAIAGTSPGFVVGVNTTTPSGAYNAGANISIVVTFDTPVSCGGAQLQLNSGGVANYVSGSGTAALTFSYVVGASDNSSKLDYSSVNALTGMISAGSLSLPSPGATGSLGANSSLIIDTTAPAVAIAAPVPVSSVNGPITFAVRYSDVNFSLSTLSASNITVNATGTASAGTVTVTAGRGVASRNVTLSNITGEGTLGISIAAGTASDTAGNLAGATVPSRTAVVDNQPPGIAFSAPSVSTTKIGPVTYTVTYGDLNFQASTLSLSDITLNTTGSATGTVLLTGSSKIYTVTITNITGNGQLSISIGAGTASDTLGNVALATGPSTAFTVNNGPPPTLFAWGKDDNGELGNNANAGSLVPIAVDMSGVLAGKTVVSVSEGLYFTLALTSDGKVYAWGSNAEGELGNNTTTDSNVPVAVDTTGALADKNVVAIAAGGYHCLALTSDGQIFGWGNNSDGELGNNSAPVQTLTPVAVDMTGVLAGKTVTAISAGSQHSLALTSDGRVFAWGSDWDGELGNNVLTGNSFTPVAVDISGVLAGKQVTAISGGLSTSLALTSDGQVFAWGQNNNGQLGNNSTTRSSFPVAVDRSGVLAGKTVTAISLGIAGYAITSDGRVFSWGYNGDGELGNNSTAESHVPVAVDMSGALAGKTVTAISSGGYFAVALTSDGQAYSWGDNYFGRLGNPQVGNISTTPVAVDTSGALSGRSILALPTMIATYHVTVLTGPVTVAITNIMAPANGSYNTGDNLDFTVNYNMAINVNTSGATAYLPLIIGSTPVQALYVSGSGSTNLLFRYTVQNGDRAANGITVISPLANGSSLTDTNGNPALVSFTPPNTTGVLVDTTAPVISGPSVSITSTGPVSYTVTYNGVGFQNSTLSPADITLIATGTATGTAAVTGTGNTRTVTLSGITGDGTLGISIGAGTATDVSENLAGASKPSATFIVDNTPPTVQISDPSTSATAAGPVTYTINYSDANGLNAVTLTGADVTLNSTGTATGTVGVTGNGTNFTVTISNITGDGSLSISIGAGTASDVVGNISGATGPSPTFIADNTPPTVSISAPSVSFSDGPAVTYTLTYGDDNGIGSIYLSASDIVLNKTGTATGTITLSPIKYAGSFAGLLGTARAVTITNLKGQGTLGISIAPGSAFDVAGNAAGPAGPSATFTVAVAPTPTVNYEVLHAFTSNPAGYAPQAPVLQGSDGALYGTTANGGVGGDGVVFKVDKNGNNYTVLKAFGGTDGAAPLAGLVEGPDGLLYGTTSAGGTGGNGVVFKVGKDGSGYTVLKYFTANDGANPRGGVVMGPNGALFGTTFAGGDYNFGVVFTVSTNGTGFAVLHSFSGGISTLLNRVTPLDGANPGAGLLLGADGSLYGTTTGGGVGNGTLKGISGAGTVFKIGQDGSNYTILHSFGTGFNPTAVRAKNLLASDGAQPQGALVEANGSVYGTTQTGGSNGSGVVFQVAEDGSAFNVLHSFNPNVGVVSSAIPAAVPQVPTGTLDGANPVAGLVVGGDGALYGTTVNGGDQRDGVVFRVTTDGNNYSLLFTFNGRSGAFPSAPLVIGNDGLFYGTTSALGNNYRKGPNGSNGGIFSLGQDGSNFNVVLSWSSSAEAYFPYSKLVLASDGALYGTSAGGSFNNGAIFKVQTNGLGYTVLKSLDPAGGGYSELVEGPDGALYGTASGNGSSNFGYVFKLNKNGSGYTVLHAFNGSDGANVYAGLVFGVDGALYGTASNGGDSGNGTVFRVAADGSAFSVLHSFSFTDGANPNGSLVVDTNGTLYGAANQGGDSNFGVVFSLTPDGNTYTLLTSFSGGSGGQNPSADLILGSDGILYGTTYSGGDNGDGTVFAIGRDGSNFTVLHSFNYGDGANPVSAVAEGLDGALYGTTASGGDSGNGVIFRVTKDGTTYNVLRSFGAFFPNDLQDGTNPRAGVAVGRDGTLYGTTQQGGGSSSVGEVFQINPDGSGYAQLKVFGQTEGSNPQSSVLAASDGALYGTTLNGGDLGYGTLFKVNPDGSGYSVLYSFDPATGGNPQGNLVEGADGSLYGTTQYGGPGNNNNGVIFKIAKNGSGYTVLHTFQFGDGANPTVGLTLGSDGTLYGSAYNGGTADPGVAVFGVLFSLQPDGSNYQVLHNFTYFEGANPSGLIFGSDGALYGTSYNGGQNEYGVIFKVATNGANYNVLHSFTGTDGSNPTAGLLLASDGSLYGTANNGGNYGYGVVFQAAQDGSSYTALYSFTGNADGANPNTALAEGTDGFLYGTTQGSTSGNGEIFEIGKDGTGFLLIQELTSVTGFNPQASLVLAGGTLYGTTYDAGTGAGVVYRLTSKDNAPPLLAISAPSSGVSHGGAITYTVTYTDPNFKQSTLSPSNVTLNQTGNANGQVTVTGNGTNWTVTINNIVGTGSLGISIQPGTAVDYAGNLSAGMTSALFTVNGAGATLTVQNLGYGTFQITLQGAPSTPYQFQATPDLNNPNWQTLQIQLPNTDQTGILSFNDSPGANTQFYRAFQTPIVPR